MTRQACANHIEELRAQAAAWVNKPGLRAIYGHWYRRIAAELAPLRPIIEIGAGCGNFKRFLPEVVATDVVRAGDWIDHLVDARSLPYPPDSVGNFVLIDCLHHLPNPLAFLRDAMAALQPDGRVVLFEPAATPWARVVWALCHHERVDMGHDFFAVQRASGPIRAGLADANMGTAQALFVRHRARTLAQLPAARLAKLAFSDLFVYPASGGFRHRSLLPPRWLESLHRWETAVLPEWLARWVGLRMLVVLAKKRPP